MKKLASILLTICMLGTVGVFTAFAGDSNVATEEGFFRISDNNDLISIEDNLEATEIDAEEVDTEETQNEEGIQPMENLPVVQGEYVDIFPLVEEDGQYKIYPYGYRFPGVQGNTYARGTATVAIQDQLIDTAKAGGYEPIGWYVTGSIYIQADKPQRFVYNIYPKENDKSYAKTAQNGSNVFSVAAPYPSNISTTYSIGIKGTVYFSTNYPSGPVQGHQATSVQVSIAAR